MNNNKKTVDEANQTYSDLLKAELFGNQVPSTLPTGPPLISSSSSLGDLSNIGAHLRPTASKTPPRLSRSTPTTPNKNLFQYKSSNHTVTHIALSSPLPTPSPSYHNNIDTQSSFFQEDLFNSRSTTTELSNLESSSHDNNNNNNNDITNDNIPTGQNDILASSNLLSESAIATTRLLSIGQLPNIIDPTHQIYSTSPVGVQSQRLLLSPRKRPRGIPKVPFKVLDAPDLVDDFYLNLIDWGDSNKLSVGLGNCVYIWDAATSAVNKLCQLESHDLVTSVSWMKRGTHIAVGTKSGAVQLWDVEHSAKLRVMSGHNRRAGALSWNENILTSGSKDRTILHRDVRIASHYIKRLSGHKQEICGLKWNVDENTLASGGNDNRLVIWDKLEERPLYRFTDHKAAIKAIAWSPYTRGLLASGGGTADQRIRFWNIGTGTCINEIDTGSQVCNLAWSKTSNELISTHGYSQNQVVLWKYPSLQQVAVLTGHTYRVLYLAMSPDGRTIVTGAGDETLRFWNVFGEDKVDKTKFSPLLNLFPQLR